MAHKRAKERNATVQGLLSSDPDAFRVAISHSVGKGSARPTSTIEYLAKRMDSAFTDAQRQGEAGDFILERIGGNAHRTVVSRNHPLYGRLVNQEKEGMLGKAIRDGTEGQDQR